MHNKPSLPSPWATTLGSVYSGRRPNSQLNEKKKHVKKTTQRARDKERHESSMKGPLWHTGSDALMYM